MLDKYVIPILKPSLRRIAKRLQAHAVTADRVTVLGFAVGILAVAMLAFNQPLIALILLLLNRLADGVDGELARLQTPSDAGGYLDITLDFIFYALFPIGFALADPAQNALPAALLVASFMGTGSTFLAFSTMAVKHNIHHPEFSYKSLHYLNGLAEGTETVLFFMLMCLLPHQFPVIAIVFALVCLVTTVNRVVFGYRTLRGEAAQTSEANPDTHAEPLGKSLDKSLGKNAG